MDAHKLEQRLSVLESSPPRQLSVLESSPPRQISSSGSASSNSQNLPAAALADPPDYVQIPLDSMQQLQFDDSDAEFRPMDGGCAAWLVCFTSFCANGTIFSIINSFGIISEWLISKNGANKSMAGAIGSAALGCLFFFSFMSSIITDRIGIRTCAIAGGTICSLSLLSSSFCGGNVSLLIFTHSVLFGLGSALAYTPSLVILGHHFERHLGLVNGVVTLGSGVFSVALTRLLKPCLLDKIGLHNTFRVLCGMSGLIVVYALAWVPRRPVRHSELDHYLSARSSLVESVTGFGRFLAKFFNVSIWRSRGFIFWTIACPCAMFGYFVPIVFLPNFIQEQAMKGLNLTGTNTRASNDSFSNPLIQSVKASAEADSATLLICISIGSGIAKLAVGKLADFKCLNRLWLQQAAFCNLGISIMLFPLCRSKITAIILAIIFGICDGAFVCLMGPIAFDLVGPTGASQAIGFLLLAMSLPTTTGPLLAGYINDATGRWDIPFYISGVAPIVAASIMFLIPRTKQTYPAATVAEDFDQMSKSYLDIGAYKEGQVRDASGSWRRASGSVSADKSTAPNRKSLELD